jgi:quercetin dioxygenase-like cupin family protein
MIVSHKDKKIPSRLEGELKNVVKRVLITPQDGWKGWVMRHFEIGPEGYTLKHSHPWPHINYIIKGQGMLYIDGKEYEITEGSFAYIPSNALHQFINIGKDVLELICIVPEEGESEIKRR